METAAEGLGVGGGKRKVIGERGEEHEETDEEGAGDRGCGRVGAWEGDRPTCLREEVNDDHQPQSLEVGKIIRATPQDG